MSKLRIDVTGVPFHVFARGNNKQDIFFDEIDRLVFLKYCREAKEQFDFRLFTYALMNNHFHLLLQMEKESSLAQLMQGIQFQYARYINRKFRRVGHLFQGRYVNISVEKDAYFLTVDRYIHLNPVRAGMVARPEDFPWSSYRARFENHKEDWLDHHAALDYFGNKREAQLEAYRKFTEEAMPSREDWSLEQLAKMTSLGSPRFHQQIKNRLLGAKEAT